MEFINSKSFKNPVTGKKQQAADGVRQYGFDGDGNAVYGEAVDSNGTYHFMGQITKVCYMVYFKQA
jgi:hypothetical protein